MVFVEELFLGNLQYLLYFIQYAASICKTPADVAIRRAIF
jgi:hypothetical protein